MAWLLARVTARRAAWNAGGDTPAGRRRGLLGSRRPRYESAIGTRWRAGHELLFARSMDAETARAPELASSEALYGKYPGRQTAPPILHMARSEALETGASRMSQPYCWPRNTPASEVPPDARGVPYEQWMLAQIKTPPTSGPAPILACAAATKRDSYGLTGKRGSRKKGPVRR
jgi:hypothetical protein